MVPVWIEFNRQQRRVVCPLFKEGAPLMEVGQQRALVPQRSRKHDHVVRPFHGVDRIELNEAQVAHERQCVLMLQAMTRALPQRVLVQKEAPGLEIGDDEFGHECKLKL